MSLVTVLFSIAGGLFHRIERWITGWAGLALAYAGSLVLVAAQLYTIVKRSAWIGFIKKVGGVRPWLTIHIL